MNVYCTIWSNENGSFFFLLRSLIYHMNLIIRKEIGFFSLRVMPLDSNIITNQKKLILNMCRHVADYVRDESCLMELCRSLICHLFIFDTIQILFAHLFFLFIIHWRTHSLCIQSVQGLVRTGSLPIQTVHWSWYWSLNELMPIFVRYQYFHKSSFLRPPNKW